MIKYLFLIPLIYILVGFILFLMQRKLTFNKSGKPSDPDHYGLNNVDEVFLEVSDSLKLLAWFSRPVNNKPVIVYFHGNSFDIGERAYRIKNYIKEGFGVLLPAYRGFSGNKGNPTEKNIYNDSKLFINWLIDKNNIKENDIILYGESLGTAVAVELGRYKSYKAVILEAPFTSVVEIAKKTYPIYPVKYLIWDKFENLFKINDLVSPILFIHGKKDEIVPFEMGKKLYEKYNKKKEYIFIDEAMHNNLYEYGIADKVIEFINKN